MGPAELEYLLPGEFDLAVVGARLPGRLELAGETVTVADRTFYDTFDHRLRAKRRTLVHDYGRLALLDESSRELAALDSPYPPERLLAAELPDGALRAALEPTSGVRALLPTAHVHSRRRATPVLDARAKTVVRLIVEEATVSGGAGDGVAIRPRLHVLGVRGYDKALARVRRALEDDLGLVAPSESLADEASLRAGGSADGFGDRPEVGLASDMRADRAAAALLLPLLAAIERNLPGTLADVDTEFLHDFRVAVRRTRSLQRELKRVFPPEELAHFRAGFRWLQQVTGPSRDLDVYLLEFGSFRAALPEAQRADLDPLRVLLAERRAAERERMEAALRTERTRGLLTRWASFLERLPDAPVDSRPDAAMPIAELAARRISRVYRQMTQMGGQIDDSSPHVALHDLRKKGKELRYLLEFFGALFSGDVTKSMVRTLKALQDTLGRFQDREVQAAMVRSLGSDLAVRENSANVLMAVGVLVERLDGQQAAARADFKQRFAAFAAPRQRALVRSTFR